MNQKKKIVKTMEQILIARAEHTRGRESKLSKLLGGFTITQLHIAALIDRKERVNNRVLSDELGLTRAAISKAVQRLLKLNQIESYQREESLKEVYYRLTPKGRKLAEIHHQYHKASEERYLAIFNKYQPQELEVIQHFLNDLLSNLQSVEAH